MVRVIPILALLARSVLSVAVPWLTASDDDSTQLPLVIWHGLGDDFERDGLHEVASLADSVNPGTYVHIIRLADDGSGDRQATFFGNVTEQIETVCKQLASDPILSTAPAVNALGFSQGGQFLRGYIERCNHPPVHNLVTFGSQHNGISEFQSCKLGDWLCNGVESLLRSGRWSDFAQSHVVPAQYFRDPEELDPYLEYSNFLADINNEREFKNVEYKKRLTTLNAFAMFMFEDDTVAVPKESALFAEFNATDGTVTPLQERKIYKEDWLGLKKLDREGKLHFKSVPGQHMHLTEQVLKKTFEDYFGPVQTSQPDTSSPGLVAQPLFREI
jgi:palmitoyl-protein thioesterase